MHSVPYLSLITFLPILGMIIVLALPKTQGRAIKSLTLLITGIQVIIAIILLINYDYSLGGIFEQSSFQFVEKWRWIDIDGFSWLGKIKVDYFLGIDEIGRASCRERV